MINAKARALLDMARKREVMLATAESCTGGMVVASLTDIAGSSAVVDRGFVTYSNAAKTSILGVDPDLIAIHGAVSEAVVRAMAKGAMEQINHTSKLAVSISGIAGPGGGSIDKPVGLVWFGLATEIDGQHLIRAEKQIFSGDRAEIRQAATLHALDMMLGQLAAGSTRG